MAKHDDGDTGIITPTQEIQVFLTRPFLAVCGALLAVCGMVVGLWSSAIERDINEIRGTLNERAELPSRVTQLEKRDNEDKTDIAELKRWRWQTEGRNGLK
jgi:hypothetical protein